MYLVGDEILAQWLVAVGKRGFDPVGDSVAEASVASPWWHDVSGGAEEDHRFEGDGGHFSFSEATR